MKVRTLIFLTLFFISFLTLSQALQPFKENGKWGYKIGGGVTLIAPKYDTAYTVAWDHAVVGIGGKFGYINNQGQEITEIKYEKCYDFRGEYAKFMLGGKCGIINSRGTEIIPATYEDVYFSYYKPKYISVCLNKKWGLIDFKKNEILPSVYDQYIVGSEGLFAVCKDGKCGHVNRQNETVIPFIYESTYDFDNGLAEVSNDTAVGMINQLNQQVIPIQFGYISETESGLLIVQENSSLKYGVWRKNGVELSNPIYTDYYELYGGSLILQKDSVYFLTDQYLYFLLEDGYSEIAEDDDFYDCVYFIENGKKGLYDYRRNKIIIDAIYDDIYTFGDQYAYLKNGSFVGLLDFYNGNIVVKPVYKSIEELESDLFICTDEDNKSCVINAYGVTMLPLQYYSEIWMESDKQIGATNENGGVVFYNLKGVQVIK